MPVYNVQAPNGKVYKVEGPENVDQNLLFGFVKQQMDAEEIKRLRKEYGPGVMETFGRGVKRGFGELGSMITDVAPAMVGSALGFDDYAKQQMEEAKEKRRIREAESPTVFESYKDVEGIGDAIKYAAETLGELVPTALTSMVPGIGAGAIGSRLAGRAAMKEALAAGPLSRAGMAAAETAASKSAQIAGKRAMHGGVYFGSFAQNAPEVFENIYRETDKLEPGVAALAGGISAVLDSIVPASLLNKFGSFGKLKVVEKVAKESGAAPKVWKTIGKEAAKAAGAEGLTETAQEGISAAAEQFAGSAKGLLDPENIERYIESFIKGAIGGAAFGGIGGARQGLAERQERRDIQEAEEAFKAQMEAEATAGTLTDERKIQYEEAIKAAREQREKELAQTFEGLPEFAQRKENLKALQARMDALGAESPGSKAAADLAAQIKAEQDALAKAREAALKKQMEADEEKAKESAFYNAEPTPEGFFTAQARIAEPINADTFLFLGMSPRSKVAQSLMGVDLSTPKGRRQFITTLENTSFTGKIDEEAYNEVIDTFDPAEVAAAREEVKGGSDVVERTVGQTSGAGIGVSGKPATGAASETAGPADTSGVVPPATDVGAATGRTGEQSAALDTQYVQQVMASFTALPKGQRATVAQKLGVDPAQIEAVINEQPDVVDDTIATIKRNQAYANQVTAKFNALPEEQRVDIVKKLKTTETAVQSNLDFQQAKKLDEAIATVKRAMPRAPNVYPFGGADPVASKKQLENDELTLRLRLSRATLLTPEARDAKSYFSKVSPDLALDSLANDLVFQNTPYRNSKMTLPSVSDPNKKADTPEPTFGTEQEAGFFKGQGGEHARNAEKWVRENLSPNAIGYLDERVAEYQRQKRKIEKAEAQSRKKENIKKAAKAQARREREEADEVKQEKKANVRRAIDEMYYGDMADDALTRLSHSDLDNLLADADVAALHTQAHPAILYQLRNNNLVGALIGLSDSSSSPIVERIAAALARVVSNVNVVYGADTTYYNPRTNTVYFREGASEYEILHEATHAAVSHVLANPSHPVTREITNLFTAMRKHSEGAYGTQNVQEFAAEAWSNDSFRDHLKQYKPYGQKLTGWERIVNAVRRLLGFPPKHETAYDKLDRLINDIISPPPETRQGESLYAQSMHMPNVAHVLMDRVDAGLSKISTFKASDMTRMWATLEKLTSGMRKIFYRTLNASALGQVGSRYFGDHSIHLSNLLNQMPGFQERLLEAMQPLHRRLTDLRSKDMRRFITLSKLINATTIPDIRPYSDPKTEAMYKGTGKWGEYVTLRNRFNKLTPEEQTVYRDYFATFKALDKEFEKSLEGNIENMVEDKEKALSAYNRIMQELATIRIDHYAPLYREGIVWLNYETKDGTPVKQMFATQIERAAARRKAEAEGGKNFQEFSRAEQLNFNNVPDGTMLSSIMKIMKETGAGEEDINKLIQLVVQALPETSILKSRQRRTGVAGYIDDNAALVFDRVTSNSARQIARIRYGQQMKRVLAEMRVDQAKLQGDDSENAKNMLIEFEGRYNFAMNPTLAAYSQWASTGAFYWNLAGNISSALVNVLQTPMIVFPQLGGKYGFDTAYLALNNARKLYTSSSYSRKVTELSGRVTTQRAMNSIENLVNSGKASQYAELFAALKGHGLITTSTARDALHSENNNSSGYDGANKLSRVTTLVGTFMFHHAERMNREITAVAAYDLEMQRLKNSKLSSQERQDAAIQEAIRMVEFTHGAGSTLAGPSLGQSNIGKVLMVFKRFAFSMYYMLFDTMFRSLPIKNATEKQKEAVRVARRQLAGVYGMAAIFAGAKGLPMYWVAELAYNMLRDDDEDDFDAVMRKYLPELLYKGPVNYFTNLSIADRVGWNDLIWRDSKGDRAGESAVAQYIESIIGAPYSILKNFEKGFEQISEGHLWRGIETMLPASVKNVMKGGRYALEGANTLRGDPVMGDINGYNAAMQVLGFAPADLMKQYEENAYIKEREGVIKGEEKRYLKRYYLALRQNDIETMQEMRQKLFALGAKYPEMRITEDTIQKSVKGRDRISKDMHHGIQIDSKLRARLEAAASDVFDED